MKKYSKYLVVFMLGIISSLLFIRVFNIQETETRASFKDVVEIQKIIETINIIDKVWVGDKKVSKKEHYESALRGILANLDDPYSEYLSREELKDLNENLDGVYSGVGMTIRKVKGESMEVISPFIGSPAFKANIQIGDRITKIDGEDIKELTAVETSKKLKGPKGTSVEVEVVRKGLKEPLKIILVRDNIKIDNVEYKMLDSEIGYISLLQFGNGVANEIEKAIKELESKNMKKLILDLRTNPGGALPEAIDLASLFVKEENLVSLNYKDGTKKMYTRTKDMIYDGPMVVLVNSGSASASEILTGILKDYDRATIIGEKTYGKGVAQSVIPFRTGDAIKVTIAKYHTPKNDKINKNGIQPHIKVEMDNLLSSKGYSKESKEAKENRIKEIEKLLVEIHGEKKAKEYIEKGDIQLKKAIELLKSEKKVGK